MRLFRKNHTPEELGAKLYEALRAGMASETELSVERFVGSLDMPADSLDEQYVGEVMIGAMFAAQLAVERSTWQWIARQIARGMFDEFILHLREQGASAVQIAEWESVAGARFAEYRSSLEGYEGFEPPWKLGRQFFWAIVGTNEYRALPIKIATYYLLEAQNVAQHLINQYGPTLVVDFAS